MDKIFIGIIVLVIAAFGYYEFTKGPSPYRGRSCTGKAWKKNFPNSSKDQIREFLECLVDGMGLSTKTRLKFHPNDQVIDIYRSLYGGRTPAADQMECETFLENLSTSFSIDRDRLLEFWHEEITLRDLYEYVESN